MNRLRQFWQYADKVFDLPQRLRGIGNERPQAQIPTPVLSASLVLGTVLRVPSLLQLQAETARRGWQRLLGWNHPISDDTFGYVLERYRPQDWRDVLVAVNRTLKANKALESAKMGGLLVVAIDGNEQFHSVLKQQRFDIYQEATALSAQQTPQRWKWRQRGMSRFGRSKI